MPKLDPNYGSFVARQKQLAAPWVDKLIAQCVKVTPAQADELQRWYDGILD